MVAGCQAGSGDATRTEPSGTSGQLVAQDVEAPNIYDVNEAALWDGRPSLGGVWIAAPDVNRPERVIMRNPATGKFVIGALFKRERDNPGPRLQLSSEAAQALGVLAGAPTEVSVIALRREETPVSAEAEALLTDEAPEIAAEPLAADAEATPDSAAASEPAAAPEPDLADDADPETWPWIEPAVPAAVEAVPDEADKAADPMAQIAAAVDAIDPVEGAAPAAVAASTLDAPAPAAAALDARVSRAVAATEAAESSAADAPVEVAAAGEAANATATATPFLQIGAYRDEAEARAAAEAMAAAGLPARIRSERVRFRRSYRVLVGPTPDAAAQAEMLVQSQELGYGDAFPVEG